MIIRRDKYINELIGWKHTSLIKIVTGIRRCGKSFLLFNLFHQHLVETGTDEKHIIEIALDDISNEELRDPFKMLAYVKEHIKDKEQYYLIIDEVQLLDRFVDVLNSFMQYRTMWMSMLQVAILVFFQKMWLQNCGRY